MVIMKVKCDSQGKSWAFSYWWLCFSVLWFSPRSSAVQENRSPFFCPFCIPLALLACPHPASNQPWCKALLGALERSFRLLRCLLWPGTEGLEFWLGPPGGPWCISTSTGCPGGCQGPVLLTSCTFPWLSGRVHTLPYGWPYCPNQ